MCFSTSAEQVSRPTAAALMLLLLLLLSKCLEESMQAKC
jgi:hypothetical protein